MKRYAALALAALALPGPVAGQELLPSQGPAMQENLEAAQTVVGNAGPLDRAGAAISGSALQFDSLKDDSEISLAMTFDLDRYEPKKTSKPGTYRLSDLKLVVKGTVPVTDDDTGPSLFAGDHIVSGSRITLAVTRTSSVQLDGRNSDEALFAITNECILQAVGAWESKPGNSATVAAAYRAALDVWRQQDHASFEDHLRLDMPASTKQLTDAVVSQCVGTNMTTLADTLDPSGGLKRELEKVVFANKPLTFMGLDASYGRDDFDTLDRDAFEVRGASRDSWEVGAYWGMIGPGIDWSLRARATYGAAYEEADSVQLCRPIDDSTEQECIEGPDGLPTREKSGLLSVEGRKIFALSENQRFAIAPQAVYDIDADEFRAELPIYLSPDDKGNLSGGLKLAYTSKGDEFGVGVFIGVPFGGVAGLVGR